MAALCSKCGRAYSPTYCGPFDGPYCDKCNCAELKSQLETLRAENPNPNMNTPNDKTEHSKEPWSISLVRKNIIYDSENHLVAEIDEGPEDVENAARIVVAVNFCKGIHIEALTLLNQADHPTLNQICEENQSLRKQLTDIKTAQQLTLSKDLSKIAVKAAHPEDFCNKCGGPNIIWFAPNELWNKHARDHGHNILCPICFTQLVEQHEGKATVWEVRPA